MKETKIFLKLFLIYIINICLNLSFFLQFLKMLYTSIANLTVAEVKLCECLYKIRKMNMKKKVFILQCSFVILC
jgi:hypothetical protein